MNIKAFFAILVCKALRFACNILHRGGTALPGRVALKICPELLKITAKNVKTIAVTGTNGKTTSARMIEEAFSKQGMSYFSNRSGANLISGITTEFVINSTVFGKNRKEYAVIECDEAAAKRVFRDMQPKVIVVTNLFRDQLDRFGEVTVTLDCIRTGILGSPDSVLCLNADCSLTASLAHDVPNPVRFYGIDRSALPAKTAAEDSDATHCLFCQAEYEYDYISYGHLGGFRCPKCGYRRPKADYAVTEIVEQTLSGTTVIMNVEGDNKLVSINLPAMFNVYNAAGAMAAVSQIGLGADAAVSALATFKCGFGRMESFKLGLNDTRMMLVKNPSGCNQVLKYLQDVKGKFSLVFCFNSRIADGTDISWIWDTDFEILSTLTGLQSVTVSGERAADVLMRLKHAGVDESFLRLEPDYEKIVSWAENQPDPVFIIPTYTALLDMRKVVISHCGGADFWE